MFSMHIIADSVVLSVSPGTHILVLLAFLLDEVLARRQHLPMATKLNRFLFIFLISLYNKESASQLMLLDNET